MSFWGREARAPTLQDHTPPLCFHLLKEQYVKDPPLPPPPPILLQQEQPSPLPSQPPASKGNRKRWALDFGKYTVFHRVRERGRNIWFLIFFLPLAVSRDLIYKTAFETTSLPVYFLCQPGLFWSGVAHGPLGGQSAFLSWNQRVMSGKSWWDGLLDKKDSFLGDRLCPEFCICYLI